MKKIILTTIGAALISSAAYAVPNTFEFSHSVVGGGNSSEA